MTLNVHIPESLNRFLDCVKDAGRHGLFSVAANALKISVQEHLRREVPRRHATAERLGGDRTMHLEKGAARVTWSADANHGEVIIPIAGIGRALHDVVITPKNGSSLTIPVHGAAYGHRVAELQRMGWSVFRPKGTDVLMGEKDGQAVSLYALKKRVSQRQDRTLLPSDEKINGVVTKAMLTEIQRVSHLHS